jgi:hypothetical protein
MSKKAKEVCGSCGEVHSRRKKADMAELKDAIYDILEEYHPMTVRALFYQLVARKLICKSEKEYDNVAVRLSGEMREENLLPEVERHGRTLPWEWIVDQSRWVRKPRSYASLAEALEETAEYYRADMWREQPSYVEVWCEKATLSGLIYPITSKYDVPFYCTGGFSSKTFLHEAAEGIAAIGKATYILILGDHDPSGESIDESLRYRMGRYAPSAEIYFHKLAVTEEQIVEYNLPTRPTKTARNSHAKGHAEYWQEQESVEVDALPPGVLEDILEYAITCHIDKAAAQETEQKQIASRVTIGAFKKDMSEFAMETALPMVRERYIKGGLGQFLSKSDAKQAKQSKLN